MLEGLFSKENVLVLVDGRQDGETLALVLCERFGHLKINK